MDDSLSRIQIFSFDPGLNSGWCHLSVEDNKIVTWEVGQSNHFEIGDMLRNGSFLPDSEVVFICESYRPNPRQTPAPWSLETIGLIRYWANAYSVEFSLVSPSEHKSLITDTIIKRAGLWSPGMGHANDAVSIALWYLIAKRGLLTWCLKQKFGTTELE